MILNHSKASESYFPTQNRSVKMRLVTILAIYKEFDNSVDILYLATSISPKLTLQYHKRVNLILKQQNHFKIISPDPKCHIIKGSFNDYHPFLQLFKNSNKIENYTCSK